MSDQLLQMTLSLALAPLFWMLIGTLDWVSTRLMQLRPGLRRYRLLLSRGSSVND